jgi:hypothetical protein
MVTKQSSGEVLWLPGVDPGAMQEFRAALDEESQRREIEDLPMQEIAAAAVAVVRFNYSITEDDLLRELASVFGYARRSTAMDALLREGIRLAAMFGRLKQAGDRYSV